MISGPLAGLACVDILKGEKRRRQILFWPLLIALNLLVVY